MKTRHVWVCVGGGLCLAAAMVVQRVWGQSPPPPGLPGLPPITVPSRQLPNGEPPATPTSPAAPVGKKDNSLPSIPLPNAPAVPTLPAIPLPNVPAPNAPPVAQPNVPSLPQLPQSAATPIAAPPSAPVNPFPQPPMVPSSAPLMPPAAPAATQLPPIAPVQPAIPVVPPADVRPIDLPTGSTSSYRAPELTTGETRPGKQEQAVTVEWVGAAMARYNQPTNYQILVRNAGQSTVNQVIVKPNLPEGAVIKSSEPALPQGGAGWDLGTLAPGQLRKIEVVIQSQKRGYQNYNATVLFAANTTHLTEVREPLLQIKMKAPDKALVGEPAPILFTISNPGDGTTENVKIRAILPEGLEHPRGQAFEIDAGNLAPKETRTLQLACVAKGQGQQKATLIASADGNLNATDVETFELLLPRLDIVLNGPKLRFVERPARYTVKVTNPGTAPAQAVVLSEVVPQGFKFAGASNQGRYDEITRTVQWQVGDLQPGQNREITVDLIPTVPGDHRLAASVVSARGVRNESAVQTRVEGLSNIVLEVANADNPIEVGADATYEIRIANAGTKVETNVELTCTLPDSVDFRDAKSAAGNQHRMEGRDVVFEAIPRLSPRAEVIYRVTVKGRLPGDVRFRARVRAEGMTDALIREEMTKFYDDTAVR